MLPVLKYAKGGNFEKCREFRWSSDWRHCYIAARLVPLTFSLGGRRGGFCSTRYSAPSQAAID